MSSVPVMPSNPATQLCDYCHQKPKFSNHSYCSKTCAGQAATLCNHCHKKPKFQNFDYCGKNCAALANATGSNARNPAAQTIQPTYPKANNPKNQNQQQQQAQPAFDPIQLAKLVAQHIPQVQAFINPNGSAPYASAPASQPIATNPFNGPSAQVIPPNIHNAPASVTLPAPAAPINNPFLNHNAAQAQGGASQVQAQTNPAYGNAMTNGAVNLGTSSNLLPGTQQLHISTQQSSDDTECLIPGCGQPVHVDAKGVRASEYCSMRHREEAVAMGLVSPCIMCLAMPQSVDDYFCSRGCREESMNKHLVYVSESECE